MAELTRVMNHLAFAAFDERDGRVLYAFIYAFEERELILDLFEMASGSRMMCNYFRFGGVARDVSDEFMDKLRYLVFERLPKRRTRWKNSSLTTKSSARALSAWPFCRAKERSRSAQPGRCCALPRALRRAQAEPYSIYDRFDFDIVTGENGDVYDRYLVRIGEIRQSIRILKQAIEQCLPVRFKRAKSNTRRACGRPGVWSREAPKGELGFYVVSDGSPNPYRYHVRATCFINLQSLETMAKAAR